MTDQSGFKCRLTEWWFVNCVLVLGWKMAEMDKKTDGGFGLLAGSLEEKRQSWYESKAGRKQTG